MLTPSRLAKIIVILIAVFVGSVFMDSWLLQPQRLEHLCSTFMPGAKVDGIHNRAQEFGVKLIEKPGADHQTKNTTLHGGSFGQYICDIQHDGERVLQSEFKKMDIQNQ